MTIVVVVLGSAVVVGLAVAIWWRRTAPGKRLRLGSFTLYYTQAVMPLTASRVAQYLMRENFADQPMDARLTREGATYQLQLICSGQPVDSQLTACEVLTTGLSDDVFAGAAVEVQVCDTIFRPIYVIPHRGRFGRRITMNAAHLFYLEGVTDSQAFDVATFLARVGVFDDAPKVAQMNRSAAGYEFRLAVEADPLDPQMVEGARQMGRDLSQVLKGAPVAVHFGKGLLGTLRAVKPPPTEPGAANSHVADRE
ncbi:MAG: hypothetical protein L0Y72_21090 [Gemmataceae bacterium]|nr:hypothetical protein [Gemmataceae bacterium]